MSMDYRFVFERNHYGGFGLGFAFSSWKRQGPYPAGIGLCLELGLWHCEGVVYFGRESSTVIN